MTVRYSPSKAGSRLRRRSSTGSMPSSTDAMSIMRSRNSAASGRPAPRKAPIGVVLVTATATSYLIRGMA